MSKIESSIDVDVPVGVAYDQWTQFEEFPKFKDAIESVKQIDDTHLHWVAQIAGIRKEWDAKITQQEPDQRVAWTSISGADNAGAVDFHRIDDRKTRVTLTMDIAPDGVLESVGDAIGVPDRQVEGDLKRFKDFIESRGSETGQWRGEGDLVAEAEHRAEERKSIGPNRPTIAKKQQDRTQQAQPNAHPPADLRIDRHSVDPGERRIGIDPGHGAGDVIGIAHSGHQIIVAAEATPQGRQDADDPHMHGSP